MGHRKYTRTQYSELDQQHNMMAFIGNGFDIQVMGEYQQTWDNQYGTLFDEYSGSRR